MQEMAVGEGGMVHTRRFKAPRGRGAVKHLLQLPQRNYHHKSIFKLFEIKLSLYLNRLRRNSHYGYRVYIRLCNISYTLAQKAADHGGRAV